MQVAELMTSLNRLMGCSKTKARGLLLGLK
jgi:hypothetical protein